MRLTAAAFALTLLPALAMAAPVRAGEMPVAGGIAGVQDPAATRATGTSADKAGAKASGKTATRTAPAHGTGAQGPGASEASAAPFNPRWVAPNVQIKGLTVFVFTPGHFQRD